MFTFMASAAVMTATPPTEYLIDCSSWAGKNKVDVSMTFIARDGTKVTDLMQLQPDTHGSAPALGLHYVLRQAGWKYERFDDMRVIVRASKNGSPVRSVKFKSDVWVPEVYRQPAVVQPKK
ncbi:MAG: hypothetical protein JWO38_3643 [Gemmataceae bacterium]|nr:hypothetical protein [Gemmataceae bacterium]